MAQDYNYDLMADKKRFCRVNILVLIMTNHLQPQVNSLNILSIQSRIAINHADLVTIFK